MAWTLERVLSLAAFLIAVGGIVATAAVGQHRIGANEELIAENTKSIESNDRGINALFKENVERASVAEIERERMNNDTNRKVLELELRQQTIIENQQRLEQGQNLLLQEIRRLGN